MKKLLILTLTSIFALTLIACGSTQVVVEETPVIDVPETVVLEQETSSTSDEELVEPPQIDEEEYLRSTKKVSSEEISKEQFAKDKAEVLRKIEELQEIEATMNYEAWVDYISPESREFYSKPRRLIKTNKIKTEVLNGLKDYFTIIFIPSRRDGNVEEIRYNSPTSIKAVEVPEPGKIITYYNFVKENGEWFVELPKNIVLK